MKNTAIILTGTHVIGGAERRFARAFPELLCRHPNLFLLVNENLFLGLIEHQIIHKEQRNVLVMKNATSPDSSAIGRKLFILESIFRIRKLTKENNIAYLHFALTWPYIIFPFLFSTQYRTGISLVNNDIWSQFRGIGSQFIFKSILKRARVVDCLSDSIARSVQKEFPGLVQPNALRVTTCSFSNYSAAPLDADKTKTVVFMARLSAEKRCDLFIRSVAKLFSDFPEIAQSYRYVVCGTGPLEKELRLLTRSLGIENKIHFQYSYNPLEVFKHSKIFASLQEISSYPSQSLLEAMACENAVLATDEGETWRLVDSATGIRVAPNPKAVSEALSYLLSHEREIQAMGKAGRAKVMREHTLERFLDYFDTVLKSY